MPRIELRDAVGMSYRCDSLNYILINEWLKEWLPRLFPPDLPHDIKPLLIVHGLPNDGDPKTYDWPYHARHNDVFFAVPRHPAAAMAALRAKHRELIEITENERRGRDADS